MAGRKGTGSSCSWWSTEKVAASAGRQAGRMVGQAIGESVGGKTGRKVGGALGAELSELGGRALGRWFDGDSQR